MSRRFRPCSPDQTYLMPPSVHDWLPENHMARLLADVVSELDLSAILGDYARNLFKFVIIGEGVAIPSENVVQASAATGCRTDAATHPSQSTPPASSPAP